MSHNKKRNTAFIYEALVKEFTKAVIRSDEDTKNSIASILKEFFGPRAVLSKELSLYKQLVETKNISKPTAEKVIQEAKRVYSSFNQDEIFDEQSKLIKKINTDVSTNVFKNFVSNYKTLATISQMFSKKTPIHTRVILEETLADYMSTDAETLVDMKPIDNLTYKIFVKKFNEKYGDNLNESQKTLLSKYVVVSPENLVEFKLYVNDEIARLKRVVSKLNENKDIINNEVLREKNKEVLNILDSFGTQEINDNMIKKILKIQELTTEV